MRGLYNDFLNLCKFIVNCGLSIYYFRNIRIFLNNHITRGLYYVKAKQTKFPHPIGIVIGQKVVLGANCTIYQNVTIGTKDTQDYKNSKYPVIGNNVIIYPNSIIIGDIKIGDNAIVGANSLVMTDVEEGSTVAGIPAIKIN